MSYLRFVRKVIKRKLNKQGNLIFLTKKLINVKNKKESVE